MKKMRKITQLMAAAVLVAVSVTTGFAQTNLGEDCGCPAVASRPTVLMSTMADANGDLTANNTILTCNKTYILDRKIGVPSGKTITINAGTVVKGRFDATPANASALIVERGAKIYAIGEPTCQIVFTAEADLLDGSYPIANKGQWGGLVILGKATNNLTLAANGPFVAGSGNGKLAVANGLGMIEGFNTNNTRYQFGADLTAGQSFDDDDNSGILKYVSVRYSGAVLEVGSEINGITLGSVGRGTTIDHVEIVSCADDGIEFFGGTVNVKYVSMLFGNDDMFDWDLGWSGKAQFLFVLKTDNTASVDADNGFEMDADDQKSNNTPRSHPVIYNATMIGNNKTTLTSDNSGLAAIEAKEFTEGEINNSVFASWRYGFNVIKTTGTRTGGFEAYHNWADAGGNGTQSLKIICNTFANISSRDLAIDKNAAVVATNRDSVQFYTTDKNIHLATIPGFDWTFAVNNTTNVISNPIDALPNPALSTTGCPSVPVDGFFKPANYRGAFAPNEPSWLSEWAYAAVLQAVAGTQSCPTDITNDGVTNTSDFLELLGKFNQNCK